MFKSKNIFLDIEIKHVSTIYVQFIYRQYICPIYLQAGRNILFKR